MAHVTFPSVFRPWAAARSARESEKRKALFNAVLDGEKIRVSGELRVIDASSIWRDLCLLADDRTREIDISAVKKIDGGSMALLVALRAELAARGINVAIQSPDEEIQKLIRLYGGDAPPVQLVPRAPEGFVEHVGRAAMNVTREAINGVSFFGALVLSVGKVIRRPLSANWVEVPRLAERAGADAVPIVVLLNFLLGFVTGYEAIEQLRNYGANIYVADLVGLGVARELAPLMTAIILAGRSGAGFAAELATMKVSDEIDALRTMGIAPLPYLVWPRAMALVLVAPILTLVGDVVGTAGGMVMAKTSLEVTPWGFFHELTTAIRPWDIASGILKSCAFAAAIALIACQQGLATRGGAEGVGRRTTATVVIGLIAVVVIDTVFTVIYQEFSG